MANVERLKELKRFLKNKVPKKQFRMDDFGVDPYELQVFQTKKTFTLEEDCGTAGCIAGWTVVRFKDLMTSCYRSNSIIDTAKNMLELTHLEANDLFYPFSWGGKENWKKIPKSQALLHIQKLIDKYENAALV